MLSLLLFRFIHLDIKRFHSSWFVFVGQVISSFVSLFVYYFTSKAFGSQFTSLGMDYFSFVLTAEVTLYIGGMLFVFPLDQSRQWIHSGLFSYMLSLPQSIYKIFLMRSLALIPRCLFFVSLQLTIAILFFDLNISFISFVALLLYPLLSFFLFYSLGLISMSLFLLTGRGGASVGYLNTILAIFSGAYFPLTVLPDWLRVVGSFNPYETLLNAVRKFIVEQNAIILLESIVPLFIWSIVLSAFSTIFLHISLRRYRKNLKRFTYSI